MGQANFIAGSIAVGFLIFITARGTLGVYLDLLIPGAGAGSSSSGGSSGSSGGSSFDSAFGSVANGLL